MSETTQLAARLEEWIARAVLSEQGIGAAGGGLELRTKDPATRATEKVRDYALAREVDPRMLAQTIVLDAHEEAEGSGAGTHHFVLVALRSGETRHFGRRSFLVHVESGDEGPGSVDDVSARGLTAQLMRHHEAMSRIYTATLPTLMHAMQSILTAANNRLDIYEKNHAEVMKLLSQTTKDAAELEVNAMAKIKKEERINMVLEKGLEFAPLLVAKLMAEPEPEPTPAPPSIPAGGTP